MTNKENVEIWEKVPCFEGKYWVSNLGRVRSVHKILTLNLNKKRGYFYITLVKSGVRKTKSVHRLVAEVFIDNSLNKSQVNHIDCNKLNNSVENLEWSTPRENVGHAIKKGRFDKKISDQKKIVGSMRQNAKLKEEDVVNIRIMAKTGVRRKCIANKYGISLSLVEKICYKKAWAHVTD